MELFLEYFEQPQRTFERVRAKPPFGLGVLAFCLSSVSLMVVQGAVRPLPAGRWIPWALGLWCAWKVARGLLMAAVVHFTAETSGGGHQAAEGAGVFVLFGLTELVWTLTVPLSLILRAVGAWAPIWVLAFLVIGAASTTLKIYAIRGHYGFSLLKSSAVAAVPYLLIWGGGLAGVVVAGWSVATLLTGVM